MRNVLRPPLSPSEVKKVVTSKGWKFADLAARWGISVFWMSKLVNDPVSRPPMYDDAFHGLPQWEPAMVVRESRHNRKRPQPKLWTTEQMFPPGRLFVATDSRIVEEGTRLAVRSWSGSGDDVLVVFEILDGEATGDEFEIEMTAVHRHLQDIGLDEDVTRP
jgi:hypothetical protein